MVSLVKLVLFSDEHLLFSRSGVGHNLHHVGCDTLHILELGIVQHVLGSTIYMLVFDVGLRGALSDTRTSASLMCTWRRMRQSNALSR